MVGSRRTRGRTGAGVALAALLVGVACASPVQFVTLRVDPADSEIWVDGARIETPAEGLELEADRDHKIFVKHPERRSELVVLQSVEGREGPRLDPASVDVTLARRPGGGREVRVEREVEP